MKMKAAVMYQQGLPHPFAQSKPLVIEECDLDGPGPGELLIEVAAAGLCHSDLSAIEGLRPRPLPIVIGHEGAGIVRECGPGVEGIQPGDHVITVFVPSCGHCRHCVRGRPNICASGTAARAAGTLLSGAKRIKVNGQSINHGSGLSLFAQFCVVSRNAVVKIDKDVPLDVAAIFGCAVMTGAGAVFNTAKLQPGENIAVVGLGGVGMNALFAAVAAGAERIVAVDTNAEKLRLAKEWGATDVFLAGNADCAKAVRDATDGGLDTVIETAGTVPAMALAYDICCRGGSVFSAGLPAQDAKFSYLHAELVGAEKSIRGSYMGSCVAERDIPRFLGLYKRGKLPVDKLKAGNVSLEQINEGFDRLAEGTVLRQLLRPNG